MTAAPAAADAAPANATPGPGLGGPSPARRALSLLPNPFAGARAVIERDFLAQTSRPRFIVLRTSIVFTVVAAAMIFILSEVADRPDRNVAQAGAMLFGMMVVIVPILLLVTGPALAADAIAGERSLETLTLVLASPVRPFALVAAKYVSRLGALLVPTLATVPVAAMGFLYGGVSESVFADWLLLLLGLAMMVTAAGVLASAFAASVVTAVLAGYLIGVLLPGFEAGALSWAWFEVLGRRSPPFDWFAHNPYGAWVSTVTAAFTGRGRGPGALEFLGTAAGLSALAVLVAAWRLRREAHFESRRQTKPRAPRALRREDPVLDRALPTHPFVLRAWTTWIAFAVVAGGAWIATTFEWDDEQVLSGLNIGTWLVALHLLLRASQTFAAERQQGSLAILLTTPLRAGSIVRARLHGLLATSAFLLIPVAALCVAGVFSGEIPWATLLTWTWATAVLLLFVAALGLRISVSAPTAGRAVLLSVAWLFGALVAHGVAFFALVVSFRRADDEIAALFGIASPPAWVLWLTVMPGEAPYHRQEGYAVVGAIGWSCLFAVAGLVLVVLAIRRLEWTRE